MEIKSTNSIRRGFILTSLFFLLLTSNKGNTQTQTWGVNRYEEKEALKAGINDSLLMYMKGNWGVRLSFGRSYFSNNAKSAEDNPLSDLNQMSLLQLTGNWYFHERFFAEFSIGIQLKKDIPGTPNLFSIINGDDVEIEGAGVGFIPIELGLKYYLSQNRFRPFVGLGGGVLAAQSKFIIVEGNIFDGLVRTDVDINERINYGRFSVGFDYRLSRHSSCGFDLAFFSSRRFEEPIGGYDYFRGILGKLSFAILIGS